MRKDRSVKKVLLSLSSSLASFYSFGCFFPFFRLFASSFLPSNKQMNEAGDLKTESAKEKKENEKDKERQNCGPCDRE